MFMLVIYRAGFITTTRVELTYYFPCRMNKVSNFRASHERDFFPFKGIDLEKYRAAIFRFDMCVEKVIALKFKERLHDFRIELFSIFIAHVGETVLDVLLHLRRGRLPERTLVVQLPQRAVRKNDHH